MQKLLNLKEWLTIADAARHLSILFGEDVSEPDVLRLALDGHLTLICASLSVMSDNRIVFFVFAVAHRGDGGF